MSEKENTPKSPVKLEGLFKEPLHAITVRDRYGPQQPEHH